MNGSKLTIWWVSRVTNDGETDKEEPDRDRIDESDRATESAKPSHTKPLQRRDVLCTENVNALQLPNPSQGRSKHAYGSVQRLTLREMSTYSTVGV